MAKTLALQAIISAVDKFTSPMSKMASKAKSIGTGLSASLTLPILAIGAASVKSSIDLNKGMANVGTLIPGNAKRLNELKGNVQSLAIETGRGTDDMAEGLFQVFSAFGDTAESAEILKIAAKAATAGVSTTADSIKLISLVTKAYGDTTAKGAQQVADMAFMTNKLGETTFPELAASMSRVVPIAQTLGVSQAELFGVMATATGPGGAAAEVSTQLKAALTALLSPSKDLTILYEKMGIKSGEAFIAQEGLMGAFHKVVNAAKKAEQPLQKLIGSSEAQSLMFLLTGKQADTWSKKTEAMAKASGAANEAFQAQTQGINKVGFTMSQLGVKVSVISQKLGDGLTPVLAMMFERIEPLIDTVIGLADRFSKLSPDIQFTSVVFVGLIAAIGPLLVLFGLMVPAIAAIATPIGGVVAGIFGLIAVSALLLSAWNPIMDFFRTHWPTILIGAALAIGPLAATVGTLTAAFVAFGALAGVVMAHWEPVKNFFVSLHEKMGAIADTIDSFTSFSAIGDFLGLSNSHKVETKKPMAVGAEAVTNLNNNTAPIVSPLQPDNQVSGAITVDFKNTPSNAQVENKSGGGFVDVITDVGKSFLPFGIGG